MTSPRRDRSAALPLLAAWIALIVYASLYPFAGWHWPPGATMSELLRLQWPRYWIGFDIASNLAGYLPLGFLVYLAAWRRSLSALLAMLAAVAAGALLSGTMEVVQNLLPRRVPSLLDAALNVCGAAIGAALAVCCDALGWLGRWRRTRDRWFGRGSAGATALLLLWPAALLFPAPVPLGLGQVGTPLCLALVQLLPDASGLNAIVEWLGRPATTTSRLPALVEGTTTALGMLAPNLLAAAAARRQRDRAHLRLAAGMALAGFGAMTLSTVLNFGPEHALAWVTPPDLVAMAVASLIALAAYRLPAKLAASLAVIAIVALVVLVHAAPSDPYYAQSLQDWEQGRFVRFHGITQWLGWLWPYAALAWLLSRLAEGRSASAGFP